MGVSGRGCYDVILADSSPVTRLHVPSRYQAIDEIVWVKTNQLGRLVRTGRTGHWLNHSKGT